MFQPAEEIAKFTIDEDLTECERIKILLAKKDPTQQGYIFINAINIFRDDIEMQREIIPLLLEKIQAYGEDMQSEAGHSFFELIEEDVSNSIDPVSSNPFCLIDIRQRVC